MSDGEQDGTGERGMEVVADLNVHVGWRGAVQLREAAESLDAGDYSLILQSAALAEIEKRDREIERFRIEWRDYRKRITQVEREKDQLRRMHLQMCDVARERYQKIEELEGKLHYLSKESEEKSAEIERLREELEQRGRELEEAKHEKAKSYDKGWQVGWNTAGEQDEAVQDSVNLRLEDVRVLAGLSPEDNLFLALKNISRRNRMKVTQEAIDKAYSRWMSGSYMDMKDGFEHFVRNLGFEIEQK